MIELDTKYVLHIPLNKFSNGGLVELDIEDLIDELMVSLDIDSYYVTRVESHYKTRKYDELLITVFTNTQTIGSQFRDWFLKNNHVLGQEAFAYEVNNRMIIEKLK